MLLRCRFCNRTYKPDRWTHESYCPVNCTPLGDLAFLERQPCFYTLSPVTYYWGQKGNVDDV